MIDSSENFDAEMDEPVTAEMIAETVGVRVSLVVRLAGNGILETIDNRAGEPLLPRRMILRLRKMQRLRRDLRVNFAGANVILEMVELMERMRRELAKMRARND